jgi:isopenicillin N synthase-like dioxygenase
MIHSPSFLGYTRLGAETTAAKTDLREVMQIAQRKQTATQPED